MEPHIFASVINIQPNQPSKQLVNQSINQLDEQQVNQLAEKNIEEYFEDLNIKNQEHPQQNETSQLEKIFMENYKNDITSESIEKIREKDLQEKVQFEQQEDDENEQNNSEDEYEIEDDCQYANEINKIYNAFLSKHENLNNQNSKKIIYNMCKILIMSNPQFIDNPIFYVNLMESSIMTMMNEKEENAINKIN